nr:hypothetical protein B0A51_09050 [Rachicladosporium sp. CCFEE 5018]
MADPVSVTGLALQVSSLLKQLVEYWKAVKGAHKEIQSFQSELFALKGVLRDIETAQDTAGQRPSRRDLTETLIAASTILGELAKKLDVRKHRVTKALTWPFEKSECTELLVRLERIKTWLMLYSMGEQQTGISLVQDALQELTDTVKDDIAERKSKLQLDEQRALVDLLDSPSSDAVHAKACATWQGTTPGAWFLDGYLQPWIWDDHPTAKMILLNGKSGAGKTILMSRAVDWMTTLDVRGSIPLTAKFYCVYSDDSTQDVTNVLGVLVAQLALRKPSILDVLDPKPTKAKQASSAQLESCIIAAAAETRVLLVVDALNESSGRSAIYHSLLRLAGENDNMRILVSSTPGSGISDHQHMSCMQVDMAAARFTPDMARFVDESIAHSEVLQRLPRVDIHDALLAKADGSFRWLELQIQHISTQPTARRALQATQNTPKTLDDTYAATLARVPAESRDMVKEALAWVAFAHRPLDLDELNEAVIIEDEQQDIDDTYRIAPQDLLLTLCQGLLSFDPVVSTVTVAHQSAWTYLISDVSKGAEGSFWYLDEDHWMRHIVRKCLTYLLMEPFSYGRALLQRRAGLHVLYPLLDFSSTRWAFYAANVQLGPDELGLALRFFQTHRRKKFGGNFAFWISALLQDTELDHVEVTKRAEPLYYAASYGCLQIMQMLFDEGYVTRSRTPSDTRWDIDHQCGRYNSPALTVACWRGYTDVAKALLEAGADFDIDDAEGYNCLDWARILSHHSCVELLKSFGAREIVDPDSEPHEDAGWKHVKVCEAHNDSRNWRSMTVPYDGYMGNY